MAYIYTPLMKKVLHIPERQRKSDVQHHRQADNLTARFEIAKWVSFGHPARLRNHPARLKSVSFDSTAPQVREVIL